MIKFTNFSPKLLAIASYYTQILIQFDKHSLFFLSPHSYAKFSYILLFFLLFNIHEILALPHTSGTCIVDEDFASITGMISRARNRESGPYSVTSNVPVYHDVPIEITITADTPNDKFIGIIFTVVDELGNNVGTFSPDSVPGSMPEEVIVHDCSGNDPTTPPAAAVTHGSSFNERTFYILFWIPPATNVGKVYVLGYILSGSSDSPNTQMFYRFVRDDDSALRLNARNVFLDDFE